MKLSRVTYFLIRGRHVYRAPGPVSCKEPIRNGAVLIKQHFSVSAVKDSTALVYRKHGEPSQVVQ